MANKPTNESLERDFNTNTAGGPVANADGGVIPTDAINTAAGVTQQAASPIPEPSADDLSKVTDILTHAVTGLTGQTADEVSLYVKSMAPTAAVAYAMQRNGDERAGDVLRAMRVTLIMTAAIYGVKLLQMHELALMSAVDIGFRMALGPAGGNLAGVAVAAAGQVIGDALAKK